LISAEWEILRNEVFNAFTSKATASTDPQIKTSAYEGIASCDLQLGKNADAKAELRKILLIKGISADVKSQINQAISSL